MDDIESQYAEHSIQPPKETNGYKIGFYILLFISFFLLFLLFYVIFLKYNDRSIKSDTIISEPNLVAPTTINQFPTQTAKMDSYYSNPTPTPEIDYPISSPTPNKSTIQSSLCPVKFLVSPVRILITSKNQYGLWQLIDRPSERFTYLPRAEEINGKEAELQLRAEGQVYFNGESEVSVHCQDNKNKWSQEDFISYVKKSDALRNPLFTKTQKWGREVYVLTDSYTTGETYTLWLFASPSTLFHVQKTIYNTEFAKETEEVFNNITFY